MLYDGVWVAERYAAIEGLFKTKPEALHPVTREVIGPGADFSAADAFRGMHRLEELKRIVAPLLQNVDMLCVPSTPTLYSVGEVEADPVGANARLGTYTNFVNLLDLCGIAVPAAPRADERPGSVTLLAPAGADGRVAALARGIHGASGIALGTTSWMLPDETTLSPTPTPDEIELAVVGAHMSGLPLNSELTGLGARFLRTAHTAPCYCLYALAGGPPFKPGLVRVQSGGAGIEIETWAIPKSRFGEFMDGIPGPLGIGTLTLENGEQVKGFLCEPSGLRGAIEITEFGGWRNYLASADQPTGRELIG